MAEPQVYLEKISLFSRMLRQEGLAVSPQETADACRVLTDLGFADRSIVKAALETVFAKSREEQNLFRRVFDGFFVSEEEMRRQAKERMEQEAQIRQIQAQAEKDLQINGQPMELSEDQRRTYAAMPEEERQRLRDFMERYQDSAERNPQLYGNFIHSVFARALLEQQMRLEDAGVGCQEADPELGLLYRDITQFSDREIPKAITMIQMVTEKINAELTAKRKHAGRTGALDFRRTIRKVLSTGGTFYRLHYKKKRQRRKYLVVLCDVSGSMMQFSEFALRLIQSLNRVSESSRVFLFSEDLLEADGSHLQNMDLFRNYVRDSRLYGKGTDLGTALEKLCRWKPVVLGEATTLLILSDTKTIDQPRAIRALLEAKRQAGRVLWLNPIPESKWRYVRSIQTMAALCPMVACNTLGALASACKRLAQD
ncbi:MAG TPA: VWA domain-containing protein [Candidatus Faecousia intestinigallinarum]|nr:VWA domain-containing protein [Candidatus Faecousia intestinigallinarum]